MAVEVTVPEELMGTIIGDINSRRGRIQGIEHQAGSQVIKAIVPLSQLLVSRSRWPTEVSMEFAGYEEVHYGGGSNGTEPGVPAILPKVPHQGRGSVAARLESETE
jgi:translation elongation factor EF-G